MARVELSDPPLLLEPVYRDYRSWLDENFYYSLCSYCLLRGILGIDHYEPRGYAPERIDDPHNLLLACETCNGPACKKDYHPQHTKRTVRKLDTHLILDVRADDLAKLYALNEDGGIAAKSGQDFDRAYWNIEMMKLDTRAREIMRKENLDNLAVAERLLRVLAEIDSETARDEIEVVLAILVEQISRNRLFYDVFGIRMSPPLRVRVDSAWCRGRELAAGP